MSLHPFRDALGRQGIRAFQQTSPFKRETDLALSMFQKHRDELEQQVRRGDLTVKVAREKAAKAAKDLKDDLTKRSEGFSAVNRVFLDRLTEAGDSRRRASEHLSIEGLQRETNRLLRQNLVEQQLQTRQKEFQGRTYHRPFGGGELAPTLDSLLNFNELAKQSGDEAALEWSRRELEAIRSRTVDPADQRRIDIACDRPDTVNPRLVASFVQGLENAEAEALERFVVESLNERDANACVAAFLLAREAPEGTAARWVRNVLGSLPTFPDAALKLLRTLEAESRDADRQAARAQADYAIAIAESQATLKTVESPTEESLARQSRVMAKPVAKLGEPIGLALDRRGAETLEQELV